MSAYDFKANPKVSLDLTKYLIKNHSKGAELVSLQFQPPGAQYPLNYNYFNRVCVVTMSDTVADKFPELRRFMANGDMLRVEFTRGKRGGSATNVPPTEWVTAYSNTSIQVIRMGRTVSIPNPDVLYSQLSITDKNTIAVQYDSNNAPIYMGENFDE